MSFLTDFMSGLTDRFGPMAPLLGIGLLGMLLILLALPVVMKRQRDRFRELKDQVPRAGEEKKRALRRAEKVDKLEKFAHFLEPQKKEELSAAKLTMLRAGYTGKNAVRMFHAIQWRTSPVPPCSATSRSWKISAYATVPAGAFENLNAGCTPPRPAYFCGMMPPSGNASVSINSGGRLNPRPPPARPPP